MGTNARLDFCMHENIETKPTWSFKTLTNDPNRGNATQRPALGTVSRRRKHFHFLCHLIRSRPSGAPCMQFAERFFSSSPSFWCHKFKLDCLPSFFITSMILYRAYLLFSQSIKIRSSRRRTIERRRRRRFMNEREGRLYPTLTARTVSQQSNANLSTRARRHYCLVPHRIAFRDTGDRRGNKREP